MRTAKDYGRIGTVLAALLLAPTVMLSGCSSSDTLLTEKLAAAEDAATRAEKAADRAEKAADKVEKQQPAAIEADAAPADVQDPGQAELDQQQAASTPSNHG